MERTSPMTRRGHFKDNIKCWEMPFRSKFLPLSMLVLCFWHAYLPPFEVIMIMNEFYLHMFSNQSFGRLIILIFLPWTIRVFVDST